MKPPAPGVIHKDKHKSLPPHAVSYQRNFRYWRALGPARPGPGVERGWSRAQAQVGLMGGPVAFASALISPSNESSAQSLEDKVCPGVTHVGHTDGQVEGSTGVKVLGGQLKVKQGSAGTRQGG